MDMRSNGASYAKIATTLELSKNTVKSFCQRNKFVQAANAKKYSYIYCKQCGTEFEKISGRKPQIFCSDSCRAVWWATHPDKLNRKAIYNFICEHCDLDFTAYGNKTRKYCTHACYIASRFGATMAK